PADAVAGGLGEPEVAVRPRRDVPGLVVGGDAGLEVGDDAVGRDPADLVGRGLGEPEVAVRARRDAGGAAAAELGEGNRRGQAVLERLEARPGVPPGRSGRLPFEPLAEGAGPMPHAETPWSDG